MNEVKLVIRLAKRVRTPKQAALLLVGAAGFIAVIYFIPADLLE